MRAVLVCILLFTVASSCLAELTQQDLEKVGNLMDRKLEPVKLDVAEMKGKMATKDDLINMRKDFSKEIKAVKKDVAEVKRDVTEMKGNMATKGDINTVRDQIFSLYRWIIAMWVTIFLAVFGIPYLYGRADREKVKKLATDVR